MMYIVKTVFLTRSETNKNDTRKLVLIIYGKFIISELILSIFYFAIF